MKLKPAIKKREDQIQLLLLFSGKQVTQILLVLYMPTA